MALGMARKTDVTSVTPPTPTRIGASGGTVQAPAKVGATDKTLAAPGTKPPSAPADQITKR